jgi:IPT/TIG domain
MAGIGRRSKHARATRRLSVAVVSLLAVVGASTFGALASQAPLAAAPSANWTIMPSPPASLQGISCTSASSCVAVGNVIEQWNGTTWSVVPSPAASLAAVSCTSTSFCMAVGTNIIEQWNGTTWSTVPSPTGHLNGVSCTSASFCVAIGNAYPKYFIEQWNGTTWNIVPSAGAQLTGVSCTSTSLCMAVGNVNEQWNGSTWSTVSGPAGIPEAITCLSASSCTAVGFIQTGSNIGSTLVEQWNGAAWSIVPSPSPNYTPYSLNLDQLYGISCTSISACTAVGYYVATASLQRGPSTSGSLIEQWDGTSWSAPPTASTSVTLNGVSCPSVAGCIAVGSIIETSAAGVTAPPPVVTGVSPHSGPLTGGTPITITGAGFTGATAVAFDSTAAPNFTVVNDSTITVASPGETSAGAYDVTVTTPWGGASPTSPADQFTFAYPVPLVTSLSPTSGPASGGTNIILVGVGFTGATSVTFDGVAGAVSYNTDSSIVVTSPVLSPGVHNLLVTTPGGTSPIVTADQFTAIAAPPAAAPVVTSISPTSGPTVGGTSVSIKGTGFNGTTQVLFGTVPASSFSVSSSTRITAVAPAQGAGWHNVFVTTPAGTSAAVTADQFTYVLTLAVVSSLSQSSGPSAGGTTVTIKGTGFNGVTQVLFGTVPASSFSVSSSTRITAVAPAEAAGTVDVVVTTANGTSTTSSDDQFTYSNRRR